jgi:hypothetical protein
MIKYNGILYDCNTEEEAKDILAFEPDATMEAEIVIVEAATQYQRDRKVEYIKLNQFELQFDDSQDNGTRWVDAINAIKAKYPKQ